MLKQEKFLQITETWIGAADRKNRFFTDSIFLRYTGYWADDDETKHTTEGGCLLFLGTTQIALSNLKAQNWTASQADTAQKKF